MIRTILPALALLSLFSLVVRGQDVRYPVPTNLGNPAQLGVGIQRTMALLETSTPEHRNTVRILLYGQSITAGKWGVLLEEHLRSKYPNANLIYSRRALSGFSSERLVKTAEADLYPAYADLVIFHDYGNNADYEAMIRKMREQTTAEVIIQADHLRRSEMPIDESDPESIEDSRQRNAARQNNGFLPELAAKYGCAFDGRRDCWKAYLLDNKLEPGDLLNDNVHPNGHGTYVMSELIKAFLVRRSDTPIDPMNCDYVSTFEISNEMRIADDKLRFEFTGNRVDVIFADASGQHAAAMLDGHQPLDDPTMFYHGRNRVKWRGTGIPPGPWPPAMKVSFVNPLVEEKWTLVARQNPEDPEVYSFQVSGSVTGKDGSGTTDKRFVSDSGRVVIEPDDWDVQFSIVALRRLPKLPSEFTIDWTAQAQATNQISVPNVAPGIERVVTVAQRLANGPHVLELAGDAVADVKAIRVYSPAKFPTTATD